MRERKFARRFWACLLTAVMMLTLMVPMSVSAATTYTRKSKVMKISAGQSYHLMNKSIGSNQITSYTITITPATSNTRFDVAAAAAYSSDSQYLPTETLYRNRNKKLVISNTAGTFIKSSSSSNIGMLACISVRRGSATVQLQLKTKNSGSLKLSFTKQDSGHQTLKYVKVKKGKSIRFTMNSSNLTATPLVLSGQVGYSSILAIASNAYVKYTFNSRYLNSKAYYNGKLLKTQQLSYNAVYSKSGYRYIIVNARNSKWLTTNSGTITYFYPTDYVNMSKEVRTVAN